MAQDARRFAEKIGALERRMAVVERTSQLAYSSVEGGATDVYDDDGNLRGRWGRQDDGTYTNVDYNAPASPPPAPPTLTPKPGLLVVAWTGLLADGSIPPLDFARVEVHVSTSSGFTPNDDTQVTTFVSRKGGQVALALDPATYYVALTAVNTSGTESEPSVVVSGAPLPAATGAGGVTTYQSDTEPVGLGADDEGDLWFDASNGNLQHRWDGQQWVAMPVGTEGLADGAVTTAKIGDQSVDVSKLADGSVSATKIVSGAVTPDKASFYGEVTDAQAAASQALSDANNITTTQITDGAITTAKIAAGAVAAGTLAADAVTAGTVAAGVIGVAELAANSVVAGKIAAGAVTADKIEAGAITTAKIAAGAVQAGNIAAGSIGVDELDAGVVTGDKLASEILLSSRIISGDPAGARLELSAAGFAAYDGANKNTFAIDSDTGNVTMVGLFKTDDTGPRVQIGDVISPDPYNTLTMVEFNPGDGSGYASGIIGHGTGVSDQSVMYFTSGSTNGRPMAEIDLRSEWGSDTLDLPSRIDLMADLILVGASATTDATKLDIDGFVTITTTRDANTDWTNEPPLRIGDPYGNHMRLDGNELISMSNEETQGSLYLNTGGDVTIASKKSRAMRGIDWGYKAVDLDGNGNGTVGHSLGQTPTAVFVMPGIEKAMVGARGLGPNDFTIGANHADGSSITGSMDVFWLAII